MKTAMQLSGLGLAGLLLGLGFQQEALGWYVWFGFIPFFWVSEDSPPLKAAALGLLFGTLGWIGGIHWLGVTTAKFMKVPLPVGLFVFLGITAVHGFTFALWGYALRTLTPVLTKRLGDRRTPAFTLVAVASGLVCEG